MIPSLSDVVQSLKPTSNVKKLKEKIIPTLAKAIAEDTFKNKGRDFSLLKETISNKVTHLIEKLDKNFERARKIDLKIQKLMGKKEKINEKINELKKTKTVANIIKLIFMHVKKELIIGKLITSHVKKDEYINKIKSRYFTETPTTLKKVKHGDGFVFVKQGDEKIALIKRLLLLKKDIESGQLAEETKADRKMRKDWVAFE